MFHLTQFFLQFLYLWSFHKQCPTSVQYFSILSSCICHKQTSYTSLWHSSDKYNIWTQITTPFLFTIHYTKPCFHYIQQMWNSIIAFTFNQISGWYIFTIWIHMIANVFDWFKRRFNSREKNLRYDILIFYIIFYWLIVNENWEEYCCDV